MQITGWHIESFGHLHDVSLEGLEPGLNVIVAPNEWGKTTTHRFLTWTLAGYPSPQHREVRRYRSAPLMGGTVELHVGQRDLRLRRVLGEPQPVVVVHDHHSGPQLQPAGELATEAILDFFSLVHSVHCDDLRHLDLDDPRVRQRVLAGGISGAPPGTVAAVDALQVQRRELLSPRAGRIRVLASELDQARRELADARAEERDHERLLHSGSAHIDEAREVSERIYELERRHDSIADSIADSIVAGSPPAADPPLHLHVPHRRPRGLWFVICAAAAAFVTSLVVAIALASGGTEQAPDEWSLARLSTPTMIAVLAALVVGAATGAGIAWLVRTEQRDREPSSGGPATEVAFASDEAEAEEAEAELAEAELAEAELAGILSELDQLVELRIQLLQSAGALRQRADDLASSTTVSDLANRVGGIEVELRRAASSWLAMRVAEQAIDESLRRTASSRPAVMATAADWFERISAGQWSGIELDGGRPLRVHRHGGAFPLETGLLSRGATEQLHLCIRLALACHCSPGADPMPLLLDDVLVNADDRRALELVRVLVECSRHCQVLLFTAHQHTLDLFDSIDARFTSFDPAGVIGEGRGLIPGSPQ